MECQKWPWVSSWPTRVQRSDFKHTRQLKLGYKSSWLLQHRREFFSQCLHKEELGFGLSKHVDNCLRLHWPHLTVQWFLWLNKKRMKPMKKLSLCASLSSLIIFKGPPKSSMTSYIFRGRLRQLNRIPWDFNLCYPVILTNTLVPQACLSSILQNQQGVAFHALTISPFLVIDDKYVEVFNGNKICEGINK